MKKRYRIVEFMKGRFVAQEKGKILWHNLGHSTFIMGDGMCFFTDYFGSEEDALRKIEKRKEALMQRAIDKLYKPNIFKVD